MVPEGPGDFLPPAGLFRTVAQAVLGQLQPAGAGPADTFRYVEASAPHLLSLRAPPPPVRRGVGWGFRPHRGGGSDGVVGWRPPPLSLPPVRVVVV
eukprot:800277-Pyramimonas_sp.AAC.1